MANDAGGFRLRLTSALARFIGGPAFAAGSPLRDTLASVTVQVDDAGGRSGGGWVGFQGGPNDRDHHEIVKLYEDALTAWRKNPMAKRIIDCTVDYVLGDGMRPSAPGQIGTFIRRWWDHPQNHMPLRLPLERGLNERKGDIDP